MSSRQLDVLYSLLAVIGSAMVIATRSLPAQEPEPDPARVIGESVERQLLLEVETRLKSKDLATIAWGGYLAAQHRVSLAAPRLKVALKELPRGPHRNYAAQALMDALVVLKVKVAGEDFEDFQKGINEGVAIALTAADPASNCEFLRSLYRKNERSRFSRWLVAGNLLARIKDREFGRDLVEQLAYQLDIQVTVEGSPVGFGIGGAFGARFADGRLTTPMGFPPSVTYRILHDPKPGDVLVAEGKRAVYYRRQVHHKRKVGIGDGEPIHLRDRQQLRADWISAMLGQSIGKLPPEQSEIVYWTTAEAFEKDVTKLRAAVAQRHARVVDRVIKAGWFAEHERQDLAAKIAVKLHDHRSDKTVKLPNIE